MSTVKKKKECATVETHKKRERKGKNPKGSINHSKHKKSSLKRRGLSVLERKSCKREKRHTVNERGGKDSKAPP